MKILPNDQLGWVGVSDGGMQCLLVTAEGMGIRFSEEEVRPMGLVTGGVNGVKLKKDDYLVGGLLVNLDNEILLAASNGFGWRIPLEEFPVQGRYGQGTITCKLPENVLLIGVVAGKKTQSYILHYSQAASSQLRIDDIPLVKRHRAGQPITTMKPGDRVNALTSVMDGLLIWKPMPVQKRKGKK
jgi:DNA gyrase subunit A